MRVVGTSRSGAPRELVAAGLTEIAGVSGFRAQLRPPRAVLLYIPAGPAVDAMLDELAKALEPGDVIADGGNSYWGDSMRRHARLRELGIQFVDVGTSGGLAGARHGACFMAGGDRPAVALLEPILRKLAVEGGYVHAGPSGSGHFVKLVHNGIEFGMMQAIAEGFEPRPATTSRSISPPFSKLAPWIGHPFVARRSACVSIQIRSGSSGRPRGSRTPEK